VLDQIGRETVALLGESKGLDFVGDVVLAATQGLRRPTRVNWGDVPRLMETCRRRRAPIVLMINFLVGLVTGFQAAIQLRQFGANIFEPTSSGCRTRSVRSASISSETRIVPSSAENAAPERPRR